MAIGEPPPVLVSGPEQDAVLAELIEGHLAGEGARIHWPEQLPRESLRLAGFRAELRDLLMRAAEYGLSPEELSELGEKYDFSPWVAGGIIYGEYLDVTAQRWATVESGQRFDAAGIVDSASKIMALWHEEYRADPHGDLPAPPSWKTVIVDDYQEVTAATVRLLHTLQNDGAELLLFGDPDVAVQTFRGAQPALLARAPRPRGSELGAFGARHEVLETVWGQTPALREVTNLITPIIGSVGLVAHRTAASAPDGDGGGAERATEQTAELEAALEPGARVVLAASPEREIAHIAYELRRAHVVAGIPWQEMAVITRSGAGADQVRRGLLEHGVPVLDAAAEILLRAEPAVLPLLTALEYAATGHIETAELLELLRSPLGGLDSVRIRRLRREIWLHLKQEQVETPMEEALAEIILQPAAISLPASIRRPVVRIGAMLRAAREAFHSPLATPETVLWAAWHAAGLASTWQEQAIAGGAVGRDADRNLDAVLSLFAAAERYVTRMPGASTSAFVQQVRSETLPADSLAPRASGLGGVEVLTPAGAAGNRWELVCVVGVQADAWPDVRLRDTVLGAQLLTDILTGRAAGRDRDFLSARRDVLHDEARSFLLAISRARRKLLVSAVEDIDSDLLPSAFVQALISGGVRTEEATGLGDPRRVPVDLRELVAVLRRSALEDEEGARRSAAEQLLAHLAHHGVPGADPSQWNGMAQLTTSEPIAPAESPVYISPSAIDSFILCPLRWALERAGGTRASTAAQHVGNLVHELAAELPAGTRAELLELLDKKWPDLNLPTGWIGIKKRAEVEESVTRLANYLAQQARVVGVEQPFELELGRARIHGVADRIEQRDDGALHVVDFKTGSGSGTLTPEVERNSQLGVYQLAVESGCFSEGDKSAGAALVYLGGGRKSFKQEEQIALAQDEEPQWIRTRITNVAEQMAGATFEARSNPGCQWCPVRSSCPIQSEGMRVI